MNEQQAIAYLKLVIHPKLDDNGEFKIDTANLDKACLMGISALEKQLQDRWTPVSEELPEYNHDFLIQTEDGIITTSKFYGCGEETQGYKEFPTGVWEIDACDKEVIAWQPLPKPYNN